MADVKVTEADREAAAEHWLRIGRITERDAENIRNGEWDHTQDILHFTQFRLAARKEALEEAARVLTEYARQFSVMVPPKNREARAVLAARDELIRSLSEGGRP